MRSTKVVSFRASKVTQDQLAFLLARSPYQTNTEWFAFFVNSAYQATLDHSQVIHDLNTAIKFFEEIRTYLLLIPDKRLAKQKVKALDDCISQLKEKVAML